MSSGIAQKGPLLRGSGVTVAELSTSTLQPSGKTYPFEVLDDSGTFKPTNITFTSAFLESTALGYYFNEVSGAKSSDMVFLRGLSNLALGQDKTVNVNVLSTFTNQRIKTLFNTVPKKTFLLARPQAEKELLAGFYIYNAVDWLPGTTLQGVTQPRTFMELDLSKKRSADEMLAAISALVITAGQTGSGVNYLINQVETDLADDGLLNNSARFSQSVTLQLGAAAQTTDFSAVARNLNAFYGTTYNATSLSQWVDTSGGVDQVINKYKFMTTNVVVGTESRSPEYVVGTDDAGQCFSVSSGKLYRNGTAVTTATVNAVKGDRLVAALTPSAVGSFSTFLQRSASALNGSCPTVVPTTGLTRLQKFSIVAIDAPNKITLVATPGIVGLTGIALDSAGNIYVADGGWYSLFKVSTTGVVTEINRNYYIPQGVAVDAMNNVYVADLYNWQVTKTTPAGVFFVIGGAVIKGDYGVPEFNGNPSQSSFDGPSGIAIDSANNVYVSDIFFGSIRKITPSGITSTVYANTELLANPSGIALDAAGNIYVASLNGHAIFKIASNGASIVKVAGTGQAGDADGTISNATFTRPHGIHVASTGHIYVTQENGLIRLITPSGAVKTLVGSFDNAYFGLASQASAITFPTPFGSGSITGDARGNVFFNSGRSVYKLVTQP